MGITAVQFPQVLESVFAGDPAPQAAQMIANLLDAPGDMAWTDESVDYRGLIEGVDTVVLGVKNRDEPADCLRVAELGPLPADVLKRVEEVVAAIRGGLH